MLSWTSTRRVLQYTPVPEGESCCETVGAAGLSTRKDAGNCGPWCWLIAFWGAREVLGLTGEQGSELNCSQAPQGWNIVNKDLFLLLLIVGSYTKAPHERDPVFSAPC